MSNNAIRYDQQTGTLYCLGDWRVNRLGKAESEIAHLPKIEQSALSVDGAELSHLDSAGAWLIYKTITALRSKNAAVSLNNFSKPHTDLFTLLKDKMGTLKMSHEPKKEKNFFAMIGQHTIAHVKDALDFLGFLGEMSLIMRTFIFKPGRIQWRAVLRTVEDAGYHALPIIALLSFLVGIVLAYQLGRQLETYGANIYIVDLSGMAILREFGPLITAIIVAGRTGSSFTAQIGLMKVNEEIDALKTMGLSAPNRIVIPRIWGTMLALPLLTLWSNAFAVFGSMVMSRSMLDITMRDFLTRFNDAIDSTTLWTGLGKTPVFALAIALVGCFQGFRVTYTAESIGARTTMSVVQAIFLIIIIDAVFSVLYSWASL